VEPKRAGTAFRQMFTSFARTLMLKLSGEFIAGTVRYERICDKTLKPHNHTKE